MQNVSYLCFGFRIKGTKKNKLERIIVFFVFLNSWFALFLLYKLFKKLFALLTKWLNLLSLTIQYNRFEKTPTINWIIFYVVITSQLFWMGWKFYSSNDVRTEITFTSVDNQTEYKICVAWREDAWLLAWNYNGLYVFLCLLCISMLCSIKAMLFGAAYLWAIISMVEQ